eukprot:9212743-Pyramimonas_sp.AAC.1
MIDGLRETLHPSENAIDTDMKRALEEVAAKRESKWKLSSQKKSWAAQHSKMIRCAWAPFPPPPSVRGRVWIRAANPYDHHRGNEKDDGDEMGNNRVMPHARVG